MGCKVEDLLTVICANQFAELVRVGFLAGRRVERRWRFIDKRAATRPPRSPFWTRRVSVLLLRNRVCVRASFRFAMNWFALVSGVERGRKSRFQFVAAEREVAGLATLDGTRVPRPFQEPRPIVPYVRVSKNDMRSCLFFPPPRQTRRGPSSAAFWSTAWPASAARSPSPWPT